MTSEKEKMWAFSLFNRHHTIEDWMNGRTMQSWESLRGWKFLALVWCGSLVDDMLVSGHCIRYIWSLHLGYGWAGLAVSSCSDQKSLSIMSSHACLLMDHQYQYYYLKKERSEFLFILFQLPQLLYRIQVWVLKSTLIYLMGATSPAAFYHK